MIYYMERVKRKEFAKQFRKKMKETGLQDILPTPNLVEAIELYSRLQNSQHLTGLSVQGIPSKAE